MAIAEIDKVLANWNHAKGVELYEQYGGNEVILGICRVEGAFARRKLREELMKLSESGANAVKKESEEPPVKEKEAKKLPEPPADDSRPYQKKKYADYPKEIQAFISEKISLRKQTRNYFEDLRDKPLEISIERRKEYAFFIRDASEKIEELQQKINHYDRYGQLPVEMVLPDVLANNPVMLLKRRNTLRSYISHAKAGRKNADNIPAWQAELDEVEKKLEHGAV